MPLRKQRQRVCLAWLECMDAGDAFLIPEEDDHLWAVISDPTQDSDNVVIIMFVSWTEKYDQACVLKVGDHPFIRHDTCVQYPAAKVVSNQILDHLFEAGKLRKKHGSATLFSAVFVPVRKILTYRHGPTIFFGHKVLRHDYPASNFRGCQERTCTIQPVLWAARRGLRPARTGKE